MVSRGGPVGDCLRSDRPDSLRPTARLWGHEMIQRAWGNLLHTVRTGETAFDHVYGMSAFAYLDANPDAASIYNEFMANRPTAAPAVAAAYDFASFSTIVDVGGGGTDHCWQKFSGLILDRTVSSSISPTPAQTRRRPSEPPT